jgi:hypothetical protein
MNDGGSYTLKGIVDIYSDMNLYGIFYNLGISPNDEQLVITYDYDKDSTLVEGSLASMFASHAQRFGYEAI